MSSLVQLLSIDLKYHLQMYHCLTGTSAGIFSQTAFIGFNAFVEEKI